MPNCLCIMRRGILWVYGIAIRTPLAAPIKKKRTADRVSSGENIGTDTLLDIKNRQQIKAFSYDC